MNWTARVAIACLSSIAFFAGCSTSSTDTSSHGTCSDAAKNNGETDVDCGGGTCSPCAEDQGCAIDDDCATKSCVAGKCVEAVAPTCEDGKKNGAEVDVDCGGGCGPCGDGKACVQGPDCASAVCKEHVCAPTPKPTCTDGVKNGAETDVDCGGPSCEKCGYEGACLGPSDCADGVCTDLTCAAPTCDDQVTNEDETDVDCGGLQCAACATGKHCLNVMDCASLSCVGNVCG